MGASILGHSGGFLMLTFSSLKAAIQAGFQVEGPYELGYLCRIQKANGLWARALVVIR